MRIQAVGGLCNRLQAILSRRYLEKTGDMEVGWLPNDPVAGGTWEDVFEPIDGVTFRRGPVDGPEVWDVAMFAPSAWTDGYALLRLRPALQSRVDIIKASMGQPYAAMHIRRTDHVPNTMARGVQVEGDAAYLHWMAMLPPHMRVYLATDNGETQARYLEHARVERAGGDRCKVSIGKPLPGKEVADVQDCRRNGTLGDAVVDLFVCAGATYFMGTNASSYSESVERLRLLPVHGPRAAAHG
jgi:hypothetical protein